MSNTEATETCTRCNGSGRYSYNPKDGTVCYGCWGKGVAPVRKVRKSTAKVRIVSDIRTIASICAGDPTKFDLTNARALDYLGLTAEAMAEYAALWSAGVREVAR